MNTIVANGVSIEKGTAKTLLNIALGTSLLMLAVEVGLGLYFWGRIGWQDLSFLPAGTLSGTLKGIIPLCVITAAVVVAIFMLRAWPPMLWVDDKGVHKVAFGPKRAQKDYRWENITTYYFKYFDYSTPNGIIALGDIRPYRLVLAMPQGEVTLEVNPRNAEEAVNKYAAMNGCPMNKAANEYERQHYTHQSRMSD